MGEGLRLSDTHQTGDGGDTDWFLSRDIRMTSWMTTPSSMQRKRADLRERLEGKITEKEYCAAGEIISRLPDSGRPIMDPIGWVSDRDGHSRGQGSCS